MKPQIHKFLLGEAQRLEKAGKANYSVNADLRYLRALFNYGIDDLEVLDINPTRRIKFYPIEKKLKYIPPDEDIEAVFNEATPSQKKLLVFVDLSGCRISEALRATSDDIDTRMDLLTLWKRKKKFSDLTPRRIPLPPELRDYGGVGRLFPEWCAYPYFLRNICDRLKIKRFGWHAFRHRKASLLASKNIPLVEIMHLLGHDNIEVTQQYLRLLGFTKY